MGRGGNRGEQGGRGRAGMIEGVSEWWTGVRSRRKRVVNRRVGVGVSGYWKYTRVVGGIEVKRRQTGGGDGGESPVE